MADRDITIGANEDRILGPYAPEHYGPVLELSFSSVNNVEAAAVRFQKG